jgi:hypothetical protein
MNEIPITKSQITNKLQYPTSKEPKIPFTVFRLASSGHWNIGHCLVFGAWNLVLIPD